MPPAKQNAALGRTASRIADPKQRSAKRRLTHLKVTKTPAKLKNSSIFLAGPGKNGKSGHTVFCNLRLFCSTIPPPPLPAAELSSVLKYPRRRHHHRSTSLENQSHPANDQPDLVKPSPHKLIDRKKITVNSYYHGLTNFRTHGDFLKIADFRRHPPRIALLHASNLS